MGAQEVKVPQIQFYDKWWGSSDKVVVSGGLCVGAVCMQINLFQPDRAGVYRHMRQRHLQNNNNRRLSQACPFLLCLEECCTATKRATAPLHVAA